MDHIGYPTSLPGSKNLRDRPKPGANVARRASLLKNTKRELQDLEKYPEGFSYNRIQCPRCRYNIREANLLSNNAEYDYNDVICEHCRKKAQLTKVCAKCENAIARIVSGKESRDEGTKARLKLWLSKVQRELKEILESTRGASAGAGALKKHVFSETYLGGLYGRLHSPISPRMTDVTRLLDSALQLQSRLQRSATAGAPGRHLPHSSPRRPSSAISMPDFGECIHVPQCIEKWAETIEATKGVAGPGSDQSDLFGDMKLHENEYKKPSRRPLKSKSGKAEDFGGKHRGAKSREDDDEQAARDDRRPQKDAANITRDKDQDYKNMQAKQIDGLASDMTKAGKDKYDSDKTKAGKSMHDTTKGMEGKGQTKKESDAAALKAQTKYHSDKTKDEADVDKTKAKSQSKQDKYKKESKHTGTDEGQKRKSEKGQKEAGKQGAQRGDDKSGAGGDKGKDENEPSGKGAKTTGKPSQEQDRNKNEPGDEGTKTTGKPSQEQDRNKNEPGGKGTKTTGKPSQEQDRNKNEPGGEGTKTTGKPSQEQDRNKNEPGGKGTKATGKPSQEQDRNKNEPGGKGTKATGKPSQEQDSNKNEPGGKGTKATGKQSQEQDHNKNELGGKGAKSTGKLSPEQDRSPKKGKTEPSQEEKEFLRTIQQAKEEKSKAKAAAIAEAKKKEDSKKMAEINKQQPKLKSIKAHRQKPADLISPSDRALEAQNITAKKEEITKIIVGQKIVKAKTPRVTLAERDKIKEKEQAPILFKTKTNLTEINEGKGDALITPKAFSADGGREKKTDRKDDSKAKTKKPDKQNAASEPENQAGITRYALSDRTFIDKGWTQLPTEKVVRKMNVYRMRPAHPEFDWFARNKNKRLVEYDSGEKMAEIDDNGRGRWYYRNGRVALDYYDAEELNAQQRFVLFSSGEPDERGRSHPITVLGTFDYLGNGVVFDHSGKIRLKYNQTEGVVLDRSLGPVSHWKWHSLNDPPVLQQVMIDTQLPNKDPAVARLGPPQERRARQDNEEMLAIEFDNFIKEKSKKLSQKFKPFQIKMKALKINENFSLRVLDQASIYLIFRDGTTNIKLNMGMILNHQEIVDTDTAELGDVACSAERKPARTDSLAQLQRSVARAQAVQRARLTREHRLRPLAEPAASADRLTAACARPLRRPLRTLPEPEPGCAAAAGDAACQDQEPPVEVIQCRYLSRKPCPNNIYYQNTLL